MRKLENLLNLILFTFFLFTLTTLSLNLLDAFYGPFIPGATMVIIAAAISGIMGLFSPFWNVYKVMKIKTAAEIVKYETKHRIKFLSLFLGFIGILITLKSKQIFDAVWILGMIVTILAAIYIIMVRTMNKYN